MSREYLLRCDNCGKKGTDRSPISVLTIRRDDGQAWTVDLCSKCFPALQKMGLRDVERRHRREMVLTDPKDIG